MWDSSLANSLLPSAAAGCFLVNCGCVLPFPFFQSICLFSCPEDGWTLSTHPRENTLRAPAPLIPDRVIVVILSPSVVFFFAPDSRCPFLECVFLCRLARFRQPLSEMSPPRYTMKPALTSLGTVALRVKEMHVLRCRLDLLT